jgi:hypothetical protein
LRLPGRCASSAHTDGYGPGGVDPWQQSEEIALTWHGNGRIKRRETDKSRVGVAAKSMCRVSVLAIAGIHIAGPQRTTIAGLSDPHNRVSPTTNRERMPRTGVAERPAGPNQYVGLGTTGGEVADEIERPGFRLIKQPPEILTDDP